jgi:hypothetical protein
MLGTGLLKMPLKIKDLALWGVPIAIGMSERADSYNFLVCDSFADK